MTEVFTCSYRVYEPDMGQPVVCSLTRPKPPRWAADACEVFAQAPACWPLTPRWAYFRQPDAGDRFEAQLARYGPQEIAKTLEALAAEYHAEKLVLLCWEADWGTVEAPRCHRLRIARFMLEETGWLIRELGQRAEPEGALF